MLRNKRILLILILAAVLFLIPSICNAADTFTTEDGITATKIVDNYRGNIQIQLSNIELNAEGNYVWGIGTTSQSSDVTNWYTLGDFTASKKVARLDLVVSENSILSILRTKNDAYLYIKNYDTNEMIVDALNVDLTLPPYKAFTLMEYDDIMERGSYYVVGGEKCSVDRWKAATYNIENVYFKFEKVIDENLINAYNEALIKGTPVEEVFSITTTQIADKTGWNLGNKDYYFYNHIPHDSIPNERGIYILYLKGKDTDTKTIYGYKVIQLDADGPIVEKIYINSPETGTYKTGQTVKIRVGFSEVITGTTVPTLKIKFGDSADREITNGTIVNSGSGNYYWAHYIEYSYDIQDSDKGQLATVDYKGGNIKDASGNDAQLSCPVITGSNTIKANVEGTNNNQTDNQDKNTNTQTTLTAIEITTAPTRNTYAEGASFEKTGMVITAKYSDGTTKQITNYTVSPSGELKTTDTKVVISYTENGVTKTVEQKITVIPPINIDDETDDTGDGFYDFLEEDDTIKGDSKLPQTGTTVMIFVVIALISVAVISKVKCVKYKDI